MEVNNIKFNWLGHDGFKITSNDNKVIYIDPYKLSKEHHNGKDAHIILISHNHFDHLSIEDLKHIYNENTKVIAASECVEKLNQEGFKNVRGVQPGEKIIEGNIEVESLPAYNTNKNFHPKDDKKIGFLITCNKTRIYHCGDTDAIPEMSDLKPDVALVPVSGVYVMTAEEAAKAVNDLIKPTKYSVPMHYGTVVGDDNDAKRFKDLVKICEVVILTPE